MRKIKIIDTFCVMIGLVLIGYGLYLIYPPVMFIVIGSILAFPELPRRAVK